MTTTEREPILNERRAAELLDVTVSRLRKWVKEGSLPGRLLPDGKAVIVSTADLLDWIDALPQAKPEAAK